MMLVVIWYCRFSCSIVKFIFIIICKYDEQSQQIRLVCIVLCAQEFTFARSKLVKKRYIKVKVAVGYYDMI